MQPTGSLEIRLEFTAKTKCRKFETNIPRKGISGPQSVSELYVYARDGIAFSAGGNMWTDPGNIHINRSQTHECRNWGWGRAMPRKGIYKRNCLCSVCHCLRKHFCKTYPKQNNQNFVSPDSLIPTLSSCCAWILEQSMVARNRVRIGLSCRPARLHRLAEFSPWNRFLGSINFKNTGSGILEQSMVARNKFLGLDSWAP